MLIERKISKGEKLLEFLLTPKNLKVLLLSLIAINGLLFLFIILVSINNPVLLHDFLYNHGLVTYGIPRIDQVNASNITFYNYTK